MEFRTNPNRLNFLSFRKVESQSSEDKNELLLVEKRRNNDETMKSIPMIKFDRFTFF